MLMSNRPTSLRFVTLLLVIAAALVACDKKTPPLPSVLSSTETPSKAAVPLGSAAASDPSVPTGSVVAAQPAAPTSRDDASTRARSDMTKAEESNAMPKAGQANNHSSPSFEAAKASGVR